MEEVQGQEVSEIKKRANQKQSKYEDGWQLPARGTRNEVSPCMCRSDDSPSLSALVSQSWALLGTLRPRSFLRGPIDEMLFSMWTEKEASWSYTQATSALDCELGPIPAGSRPSCTSTACALTFSCPQSHQATDFLTIHLLHLSESIKLCLCCCSRSFLTSLRKSLKKLDSSF